MLKKLSCENRVKPALCSLYSDLEEVLKVEVKKEFINAKYLKQEYFQSKYLGFDFLFNQSILIPLLRDLIVERYIIRHHDEATFGIILKYFLFFRNEESLVKKLLDSYLTYKKNNETRDREKAEQTEDSQISKVLDLSENIWQFFVTIYLNEAQNLQSQSSVKAVEEAILLLQCLDVIDAHQNSHVIKALDVIHEQISLQFSGLKAKLQNSKLWSGFRSKIVQILSIFKPSIKNENKVIMSLLEKNLKRNQEFKRIDYLNIDYGYKSKCGSISPTEIDWLSEIVGLLRVPLLAQSPSEPVKVASTYGPEFLPLILNGLSTYGNSLRKHLS